MNSTELEPRHLHLHLGAIDPGVTHIHIHMDAPGGVAVEEEVTGTPTAEDSLGRLKAWDPASAEYIQAVFEELLRLGCTPHPAGSRNPQPGAYTQPYLRWTHPSHPGGAVGYLNAATFSFAAKNDFARVISLPGADARGSEVRFQITSREGVKQVVAAVRHVLGK
jgi:hypothetical protein